MRGEAIRSPRGVPVALLMGLGGAAAVASALLTWANLTVAAKKKKSGGAKSTVAKTLSGLHVLDGQVILGLGLALIVAAVLYLLVRSPAFRTLTAGIGLALGLGILALAATNLGSGSTQLLDAAGKHLNKFHTTTGLGVYAALGGGILAIVAGIWGMVRSWAGASPQPQPATTAASPQPYNPSSYQPSQAVSETAAMAPATGTREAATTAPLTGTVPTAPPAPDSPADTLRRQASA